MEKKRLVIGILAHVDSGKTTLSEALLYRAGAIRRLGRVDHRDAFLDTAALERERGITIFAKQAVLNLPGATLTLLDTPGHVDFSTEMERTLQVLDYAVLVVSGSEGVQSHTETLWRLLRRYHIPTILFVNKMDLAGADRAVRLAEFARRFGEGCVDFSPENPIPRRDEALALADEPLMEALLAAGGTALPDTDITAAIARRKIFPCWFGSALKLAGVDALLAGLQDYTRTPPRHLEFGAKVFKIGRDEQGTRLTYLKITGGSLAVKTLLDGEDAAGPWAEKADGLRLYSGAKFTPLAEALPGMVVAATGLTRTMAGQGLGAEPDSDSPVLEPVLSCRAELPAGTDPGTALAQLRTLEQEDPQLHVVWNPLLGEIRVQLMGEVQLEILKSLMRERFGLEVDFGRGSILYKETITKAGEGVGHYEPLRHYAEVQLLLEPGAQGSGLQFATACRTETLAENWQRLVLTHLAEKTHRGTLAGMPLTDVKITLLTGRAHNKHTEGGDFRQATYRAVRQGLRMIAASGGGQLLEPFYTFRLEIPAENLGRAMTDLQRMGASFDPPQTAADGETALLAGRAPVATLRDYTAAVTAYTHGRGRLACTPAGYAPCHNAPEVLAALAYDPDRDLDNSADSIFCAHGAGFLVRWDEVPAHRQVESALEKVKTETDEAAADARRNAARRAAQYHGTLAEDKELLAIFERTYGPVKNAGVGKRAALHTRPGTAGQKIAGQTPAATGLPAEPVPTGPEYLLVDGYNIIFAWDDLAALAKESLDAARRRLTDILCNYRGFSRCEVILVFDAYKIKGNPGSVERHHNISVVYTKEAETADMYIEKVTKRIGKNHRVRVATSDGMEQIIILGHGAMRVSARAFRLEVDAVEAAIREYLSENSSG